MENRVYYPGKHKDLILRILTKYGYSKENLILVDNIGKWAVQNNIQSIIKDPERLGGQIEIALTTCIEKHDNKKLRLFVFSNVAPPSTVNQILNHSVFSNKFLFNYLKTEKQFIIHRVLHEVAHVKMGYTEREEQKCDEWGLEEMKCI